jgi:hypothetical protein
VEVDIHPPLTRQYSEPRGVPAGQSPYRCLLVAQKWPQLVFLPCHGCHSWVPKADSTGLPVPWRPCGQARGLVGAVKRSKIIRQKRVWPVDSLFNSVLFVTLSLLHFFPHISNLLHYYAENTKTFHKTPTRGSNRTGTSTSSVYSRSILKLIPKQQYGAYSSSPWHLRPDNDLLRPGDRGP